MLYCWCLKFIVNILCTNDREFDKQTIKINLFQEYTRHVTGMKFKFKLHTQWSTGKPIISLQPDLYVTDWLLSGIFLV